MKTIEIPDDIDCLDLAVQDKVALATMRKRRGISNGSLVQELGLSNSGVRTMIRRFKQQGLIRVFNIEGERRFEVMIDDRGICQPGRQKVTKNDPTEIRQKMTAEPPAGLTPEERVAWKGTYYCDDLLSLHDVSLKMNFLRMTGYFASEFAKRANAIRSDPDLLDAARQQLLGFAEVLRNLHTAGNYVYTEIPKQKRRDALRVIEAATPTKLAEFYQHIEAAKQLGTNQPAKALLLELELQENDSRPNRGRQRRSKQKDSEE